MEIEGKENQKELFWQKSPFLRRLIGFSRRLPDKINPIWHLFWAVHSYGRRRAMVNMDIALAMSYVVEGLESGEKAMFTVEQDGKTITPQQSFVNFFSGHDLLHVNPAKFVCEFVDLFSRQGEEWLSELRGSKSIDSEMINRFWNNFLVLIEPRESPENSKCHSLWMRMCILLVRFFQWIRRWVRVLLSGTGGSH